MFITLIEFTNLLELAIDHKKTCNESCSISLYLIRELLIKMIIYLPLTDGEIATDLLNKAIAEDIFI